MKADKYGWHKLKEDKPSKGCGEILLYCDEFDQMYVANPNIDKRKYSHWQEFPRYPEGVWHENKMKDCSWCNKQCPDEEVGGIELDPNNHDREMGWICDHCVLVFDGKCSCDACKEKDLAPV